MSAKNIITISFFILIFSFFSFRNSQAQLSMSVSTDQEYNSNPFSSPTPIESVISSYNLGLEYEPNNWGFGYYNNYSQFLSIPERNYYWHQLGTWFASDNSMLGIYYEQRINKEDYAYYDYSSFDFYFKQKFSFSDFNFLLNASAAYTSYQELTDLNNFLFTTSIRSAKSFETKTTLIGGVVFNYKTYSSSNSILSGTFGRGRNSSITPTVDRSTSHFNIYGRIAQSLTSTTGLAVQYTNRNILSGLAKDASSLGVTYGDESQFFDDPISYEGYTYQIQLTQILPFEATLRGSYFYNSKNYPSQGIYLNADDYDEVTKRIDNQQLFDLSLSKMIELSKNANTSLSISLEYQFIKNESNSFWYQYDTNKASININFQF